VVQLAMRVWVGLFEAADDLPQPSGFDVFGFARHDLIQPQMDTDGHSAAGRQPKHRTTNVQHPTSNDEGNGGKSLSGEQQHAGL
jgi:hypothetical protein